MYHLTSTSTAIPAAIRMRHYRRRQREELQIARSEVPWFAIEELIARGRLSEEDASNPHRVGEALLAFALGRESTAEARGLVGEDEQLDFLIDVARGTRRPPRQAESLAAMWRPTWQ